MVNKLPIIVVSVLIGLGILSYLVLPGSGNLQLTIVDTAMAVDFNYLSTHGNSSCSLSFLNSIPSMPDGNMLQGSCCSKMDFDTYVKQRNFLKRYKDISQIPSDPYNIPSQLTKEILGYDKSITLSTSEQQIINDALPMTKEKGFCCCKCWRWYTYEGLTKYLVQNKHFNSQQIADLLNNSDGCGGPS